MKLKVGTEFNRIVDVMNGVFGWNYKACMKGYYIVSKSKNSSAWFPKMADLSNGKPQPGDKWYGWCNTFSDDQKYIYMNNFENPERLYMIPPATSEPHITFAKRQGEKLYRYVGVYRRIKLDKDLGWVYERIAEDINTDDYL